MMNTKKLLKKTKSDRKTKPVRLPSLRIPNPQKGSSGGRICWRIRRIGTMWYMFRKALGSPHVILPTHVLFELSEDTFDGEKSNIQV
ncbi:hypothetical protein NQ317_018628 [Molorchus minor]|uniref:Uncharacterized protein n=1 Tax=Molorchus minor TaxID=1323400 RepID=A0ABQ9J2Y6_9CUCU|nr:hypothetical protein NQ317_018628 [Molorchus minor]